MKPTVAKSRDLRAFAVVPIRAISDTRISDRTFRVLVAICSYADRSGRTWVSQERVGLDLGVKAPAISRQMKRLTNAGYLAKAKRISRHIPTITRRILYNPRASEETVRSRLSAEDRMEIAELEHQMIASCKANSDPELEEKGLIRRFSVLCDRFFADLEAEGYYISDENKRKLPRMLGSQAVSVVRIARDPENSAVQAQVGANGTEGSQDHEKATQRPAY